MSLAEWQARFVGATLLVAPLGWDCFGKDEDNVTVSFRKRLMNVREVPKTNSGRVHTVG